MDKVIFDTNAYRYLVHGKTWKQIDKIILKLKEKESRNNIETLISPIVARELLAHIASRSDPSFTKCLNAIKALYLHNGNSEFYNMIASPELLIGKAFFGKTIPAKIETNNAIGQLLYHFATNPSKHVFKKFQHNLNLNRDHIVANEYHFAMQMKEFVRINDPDATGWRLFEHDPIKRKKVLRDIRSHKSSLNIALGYLWLTYELLFFAGEVNQIPNSVLQDMAEEFVRLFPEPIDLFKFVLENLTTSEFNLLENSRSNFIWDIHLMFNVGNHAIDGSKLYFVTADKAIIRSALKGNDQFSILDYEEYFEYLK